MSKKINLIKQFDDLLQVEMPEEVSVSELIFNLTLEQNSKVDEIRRVTEDQLSTVAIRSLTASAEESLTTDVRYFNVFRELSHFLVLSTEGPRPNGLDRNTDLLPEYHPSSTAELSLDPETFRTNRGAWYASDPRIESDEVRPLVAAVYSSNPLDVQFQHAYARLLALPSGVIPREILVTPLTASIWGRLKGWAANKFKGKNSSFWRSLRAKRQLRDSKGRWIEMGGGGKVNVRFPRGEVRSVPGKVAGYSTEAGYIDFEVKDVPGLKNGLYKVPAEAFEGVAAILPAEAVKNLPVQNAVPDNDLILDIANLKPTEYPDGWAPYDYTPTNSNFTAEEPIADSIYASGDGYNVAYIQNPKDKSNKPERTQAFINKSKDLYGDSLEIVGDDGTEELDMSKPLFFVWGSKRSKAGTSPIGIAQDWAGVQRISANEDERFGEKDNQDLTPEEKPRSLVEQGASPSVKRPKDSDDSDDSSYDDGSDPDGSMPEGWTKLDGNTYLSKNRRFRVDYGVGKLDDSAFFSDFTGGVLYETDSTDGIYNLVERDADGDFTKTFPVPFFNWSMVEDQIKLIENLEALDPLLNPNISNVPPAFREEYSKLDPSERFQYDYLGPDSNAIVEADAIVSEFLSRKYPGSFRDEKFNENGFWSGKKPTPVNAQLVDTGDGNQAVQLSEPGSNRVQSTPVGPEENPDDVLTLALKNWRQVPEILEGFNLLDSFKDFDITGGRSAGKTADSLYNALYEILESSSQTPNKMSDEYVAVKKVAEALGKYIDDKQSKFTNLGPSQSKKRPANADLPPTEAQIRRMIAIFLGSKAVDDAGIRSQVDAIRNDPDSHTSEELNDLVVLIQQKYSLSESDKATQDGIRRLIAVRNSYDLSGTPDLADRVEQVRNNPGNYTVADVNNLIDDIKNTATELTEDQKKLATPKQKETLKWNLDKKAWPDQDQYDELKKKLEDNTLSREDFEAIYSMMKGLPFKTAVNPAVPLTPEEIEELEKLRSDNQAANNGKPDYWLADLPTEQPKYLSTKLGEGEYPPSAGQLVGIERFLEDRDIPEFLKQEFLEGYQMMNSGEIREWYYTFKEFPFKEQYRPKNKYGLVAKEVDGASPRMLASLERIFDKGLVADNEIAAIVALMPNLNVYEVSTQIMGEAKSREDAHDSIILQEATKDGTSINDLDLMALIGRSEPPKGWEDYKPTEEAQAVIKADEEDDKQVKEFASREARKNAARRSRYALSRFIAKLIKSRNTVDAEGKRIIDGALEDVYDLKRLLDLRNKFVITPAKVMERLQTIEKGLTDSNDAHTYGKLTKRRPKTMDALDELASYMREVIGRDGYHSGPYEYNPTAEFEVPESTSTTEFVANPEVSPEIPSIYDPISTVDYSYDRSKPRLKRLENMAFHGNVADMMENLENWDQVADALVDQDLYFIDFETTGVFDPLQPEVRNDPLQIAIYKVRNGEIVDKFVSYMNPASPLSFWVKRNLRDENGNLVTPEWLAGLPDKNEVMARALEFLGPDAILVGHNVSNFDLEVLQRSIREAGLGEYNPAGMIDTLGLADYIYEKFDKIKNPSGPFKTDENGFTFGSTSIEALARYEGIKAEGLHNAENDLEVNVALLAKMIERAKSDTDRIKDNVFNFEASKNGYDLAGYEVRLKAYLDRVAKFLADRAVAMAARGEEQSAEDLVAQVENAKNSANSEGNRDGAPAATGTPEDTSPPITVSNVVADPATRVRPPSPKQLKSVERRLLDPRGLVDAERAKEIWKLLPDVNSSEIGALVQEMDTLELDYAIANNLDVDNLRVPVSYDMAKLNAYLDEKFPNRNDKGGPSQSRKSSDPRSTISRLIYSMVEMESALDKAGSAAEKRKIKSAISEIKNTIEDIANDPSQSKKTPRPADRKNKADLAGDKFDISFLGDNFTDQQRDAIEAGLRGWDVIIKALAGSGKTTTLVALAKAIFNYSPKKRILATAFNRAIADEIRTKFPANTEVRTMDSISIKSKANAKLSKKFSALQKQSDSYNKPIIGLSDIADYFKIPDKVVLANSETISKFLAAKIALAGLNNWTISGDEEINRSHFDNLIPLKKGGNSAYVPELLELAQKIWKDKMSPHDGDVRQVTVTFNDMMKNFALTHPNFAEKNAAGENVHGLGATPDVILIDEAQDVNGVFYRMMKEQSTLHNNGIQFVVVGDPHQSIYQFRGAVNSLDMFERDVTLPLTMMFRAGQEVADYANQVLDIKDEDDERLVGNPNKKSEVVVPGSMDDPDAVLTMTNAGALEEITGLLARGISLGVTREFKAEMSSFIATAKWLVMGANEKYRPYKIHDDLAGYDNWKQMMEIHEEANDPSVARLLSIMDKTRRRLAKGDDDADVSPKEIFDELKRVIDSSRIIGIPGFVRPEDGDWGTSGTLGNFISYQIKNGNIRLFNTGDAKPWSPELKNPNNGTKNNSDTLKSLGYIWDTGKTWDWNQPVEGDGSAQLEALYNALTGNDVKTVVLTVHRSKGLEFGKVRLGQDMPKPNAQKDAESIEKGNMPKALSTEVLNAIYVGLTRTKDELDPGSADWIDGSIEEFREKRKDYEAQLEARKEEQDPSEPAIPDTDENGVEIPDDGIIEVEPMSLQKGDRVVTAKGIKRIKLISKHDGDDVTVFFEALDGGGGATYNAWQKVKKFVGTPPDDSGPSQSKKKASDPDTKYDYTSGWDTNYLGGPDGNMYRHSWKSPDGKYEADIINAKIVVRKNGKTIFEGDNSPDAVADQKTVKESSLDLVADVIESDSDVSLIMPKTKDNESQTTYEASTLSKMIQAVKDSIASTEDLISYMTRTGRDLNETDPGVIRGLERDKTKLKGLEFVEAYRKQTGKNRVTAPNSVLEGTNEIFASSTSSEPVMSQEEINAAYDEAIQAEYDYQMSLEPISRDPQFPGGERGLKELTAAVNAAERMIASIETGALDPIPNGLDPEEYVAQLRLALPGKKVELSTDENGNKFARISEMANKSGIFGASLGIFGMKDLEDTGPSQSSKKPIKSNKDAVDQVMAQVSEAMDKGIIPWKKPWTGGGSWLPTSGATGKNYKGGNLIILQVLGQFRGYEGTRWYTKNAIAKLGGYVDDNDAVMITKVVKSKYNVTPDETKVVVDPKTGDQKPDDGSRTKTRLDIDFVYNEDVVKGITIPPLPRKDPPAINEVEDIILQSYVGGPNIQYSPGDQAFWSPDNDTISLPLREQFNSTEEHLDTLFHELTHSTGAADRLDRKDLLENYGTHKDVRAREELIAEIGSAILAAMFGVNTSIENVAAYVQSWKRFLETEPNALFEAASLASKAVDYILAGYYEDNPDEEYDPENQPEAASMPIEPITGEDSTFGGLGNGINYRIEGNRIFLMGSTMAAKDLIKSLSITPKGKSIPFSFFWDRKANNWSISLADPEDRVNILSQLRDALGG